MQHYFKLRRSKLFGFVVFVAFIGLWEWERDLYMYMSAPGSLNISGSKSCRFLLLLTE